MCGPDGAIPAYLCTSSLSEPDTVQLLPPNMGTFRTSSLATWSDSFRNIRSGTVSEETSTFDLPVMAALTAFLMSLVIWPGTVVPFSPAISSLTLTHRRMSPARNLPALPSGLRSRSVLSRT